jgi:cytochrome d ubiquinol oxidase subunit II
VWLVVAGGATFAAFPSWYASMFSGFYIALLLVLVCLIVRVVSFEWRSKSASPRWRAIWLWANALGSFGAALIWGIGLSNLLYGVPLNTNHDFTGTFSDLFSPYTVIAGLAVVLLFAFHGATYLTLRTMGDLHERASRAAGRLSIAGAAVGAGFLVSTVVVAHNHNDKGYWPTALPAAIGVLALLLAVVLVGGNRSGWVFAMTGLGAICIVATLFTGLYPRVMVSDPDFPNSLTVDNAASAHYTLAVMSVVALIVTPLVLLYQGWTYHVFRQRLGGEPAAESEPEPSPELPAQSAG